MGLSSFLNCALIRVVFKSPSLNDGFGSPLILKQVLVQAFVSQLPTEAFGLGRIRPILTRTLFGIPLKQACFVQKPSNGSACDRTAQYECQTLPYNFVYQRKQTELPPSSRLTTGIMDRKLYR